MVDPDVVLGVNVRIHHPDLVNLYGCRIGDRTEISPFVEITRGAAVGADCRIASHSYICDGVTLGDSVFVGHSVVFVNDRFPLVVRDLPRWPTKVGSHVSIGSNATILGGVEIGDHAVIGAGAVVTRDVPSLAIVTGNPARIRRRFTSADELRAYAASRQPAGPPA